MAARFSIGHVAQITGLTSHTLRVWERRYGFPVPVRTQGGARRYSEEDVDQLKLIVRALDSGYRAGDVVGLPRRELASLSASNTPVTTGDAAPSVDEILKAVISDDIPAVQTQLRQAVATYGPKQFVVDVASPLLTRVGDLWATGELSIQQEHLTSELVSTQLRIMLSAYDNFDGRPLVLLATLPDEHHALGIEMVALYLSTQGVSTRMLGRSTPVDEIVTAAERLNVDVVGVSVSESCDTRRARRGLSTMLERLPRHVELWVGGAGAAKPSISKLRANIMSSWEDLDRALSSWRGVR